MEAHEGSLRGLALTADGSKLATASTKGTVIRVWDVASATCLQEFRRGVERATITCLAWSWDYAWLSCTSDKGTVHVFQVQESNEKEEKKSAESSSLTQMFFSSVRKSVEGDAKKSVCQIRGVPHPQACAFVAEATNVLAVAGWDADGNGVLLLSEFAPGEEPRRVGYHVLCKSAVLDESEEARRRRRLRGWTPDVPETPEGGRLYVGERLEILEKGMEQIHFEETDEFVSVSTTQPVEKEEKPAAQISSEPPKSMNTSGADSSNSSTQFNATATATATGNSNVDSTGTVGDSVRTEPLEDDDDDDTEQAGTQ
jgi:WD40 repeat protein